MCGIAGWFDAGGDLRLGEVEHQLRLLDHRGPDSWGSFTTATAIIGQTRLAVIDLTTGDPPIVDETGQVGACLNGEIYNYRELRDEIRRRGHVLHTTGDTEVVAALGAVVGPVELAQALDGMFSFALADRRTGRLVLGRDRFGKKPLHYWTDGRRLGFASEIKALLAHPGVPRRLDEDVIPAYLGFGYVPSPRTFYEGVRSLPPGHVLVVEADGQSSLHQYWDLPRRRAGKHEGPTGRAAATAVREVLGRAVSKRMVADVPVGAFLSGGLDSSSVVALMTEVSDQPVRTFTIGFDDAEFDERTPARLVADHLGTDHTEFVVRPDAVELLDRLVWHHDQPFGDSSALPSYLLAELTRGHVTVALSGDGGDEVLAGYQRLLRGAALLQVARLPGPLRRAGRSALARTGNATLAKVAGLVGDEAHVLDVFREWIAYVPADARRALVGGDAAWAVDDYRRIWEASAGSAGLDRFQDLTIRTYLLDDLLPKADLTSMAHALEVRSPFLDADLVDLALSLPPDERGRPWQGKRVLRRAMADVLPPSILKRPKWGFGVPLDRWFREDLAAYADELLASPASRLTAYVDGAAVGELLERHRRGASLGHALWTLCTLEVFLRRESS